jgi:LysM repeat protein
MKHKALSLGFLAVLISASAQAEMIHHHVKPGETLQKISQEHFGTTRKWFSIYNQNKSVLKTPNSVEPGMELAFDGPSSSAEPLGAAQASTTPAAVVVAPHPSDDVVAPRKNREPSVFDPAVAAVVVPPPPDPSEDTSLQAETTPPPRHAQETLEPEIREAIVGAEKIRFDRENRARAKEEAKAAERSVASGSVKSAPVESVRVSAPVNQWDAVTPAGEPPEVEEPVSQKKPKRVDYRFGTHELMGPDL